ncbi:MAG TPA: hypothetical protein VFD46_05975, partial [Chryseolinea sp.]|nr:hypothetical protein [Chryseolinea sp.]
MNLKFLLYGCFFSLALGLVLVYFGSKPVSPQTIASAVSNNLEREIEQVDAEAREIMTSLSTTESPTTLPSTDHSFFLYEAMKLIAWSTNDFVPVAASVAEPFNLKLVKAG